MEHKRGLQDKDVKKGWFYAGLTAIMSAIAMPIGIFFLSGKPVSVAGFSELGTIGDFFGGSTIGFLSLASIFFIIHAIRIQSQELSLQRTELALTRNELEETRKVHESSHKTMRLQQFENTFFNMLSLQNEIVNTIHYQKGANELKGRSLFKRIREFADSYYKQFRTRDLQRMEQFSELEAIEYAVDETLKEFSEYTSHYFKNIYSLLLFVDQEGSLNQEEKLKYINILESQLSPYELVFLLYISFKTEYIPFLKLTKKYRLFWEIDKDHLLNHQHYGLNLNFHQEIEN
ncbi:putative phage abortive infection protein [Domibacillus mangrovi]|uniref:Phage abortive infection protein n=1 Tax=Domibacillus mangrovi TaxID=1714354 RepID=A0A1Q5P4I6_9BACI|nr:putative phage abortive infection protein [Domibacillus mangrovi]OKL37012.1 hypothetical protein BLL40_05315 [Domibacillus mangrovi]